MKRYSLGQLYNIKTEVIKYLFFPFRNNAFHFILMYLLCVVSGLLECHIKAQTIPVPQYLPTFHPRLNVDSADWQRIYTAITTDIAAKKAFEELQKNVAPYLQKCKTDSTWLLSRLQMYWNTKATEVYIKAGVYDHAEGQAPVATVRFPGARDNVSNYGTSAIEDLLPYSDDPRGVWLVNRSKPGQPLEWAEIAKTGRTIEAINTSIMSIAGNAALLYWLTGDEQYARLAFGVFDAYMSGMKYRSTPHDLTHGHHETIAGLSTFEVIQEQYILAPIAATYDYLYHYINALHPEKKDTYETVLKRWAEVQIDHGVAFNNWNLMQAKNILTIAAIINDDEAYSDKKGRKYYLDYVLNKSSERQWSIAKVLKEGYDSTTYLWYECPGYATGVIGDFTEFISLFGNRYHHDILPYATTIAKAVPATAQYLFPNGLISSFGDSHYKTLTTGPAMQLLANAQAFGKKAQADSITRYIKMLGDFYDEKVEYERRFASIPLRLESRPELPVTISASSITDYVSPVLYSPNVSYLALRNGMNKNNGLMIALSGSKGNHMHAGGISMEMYGKGLVLAPESGIGTSYFQQDYAEYYSQFPAHNTVAVDGISAYPVMKSNHGFNLETSYPSSGINKGIFPLLSYADVSFIEPETQSNQRRSVAIIRTGDSSGFYVDIFRSGRRDGKDKMHDYFYHNLGQQLTLTDNNYHAFALNKTDELAFSGGHLFAYDYFWDKRSISTSKDVKAVFCLSIPDKDTVYMNLWMKGDSARELFAVKAPPSKAFGHGVMLPDSLTALPMPTFIARQSGEAWTHPFVAVYEPSTASQPKIINDIQSFKPSGVAPDFVGLEIDSKNSIHNMVFSSIKNESISYKGVDVQAGFAVASFQQNNLRYLMMSNGIKMQAVGFGFVANRPVTAICWKKGDETWFSATGPVVLQLPSVAGAKMNVSFLQNGKRVIVKGTIVKKNGNTFLQVTMPAVELTSIRFS